MCVGVRGSWVLARFTRSLNIMATSSTQTDVQLRHTGATRSVRIASVAFTPVKWDKAANWRMIEQRVRAAAIRQRTR